MLNTQQKQYNIVKDLHLKMYIPYTFNYVATIIT